MGRRAKPAKVNAEAKRPLARKAPKTEALRVHELERRLAESLEREKATGEILRIISSSLTDVHLVLQAVAENAARLCDAAFDTVNRFDGDLVTLGASCHVAPEALEVLNTGVYPFRPTRETASGRALIDRAIVHIHDIRSDPEYTPAMQTLERFRTVLAVPMLRQGTPIGTITLWHRDVRPFSDKQIALVQTFADQAVIAIENVRLFTELEARNSDLTATSEILQVISRSPTDAQPVFDAIVRNAARLCSSPYSALYRVSGEIISLAAYSGVTASWVDTALRTYPRLLTRDLMACVAVLDRQVLHVEDVASDARFPIGAALAVAGGYRSALSVPMLHHGQALGVISVAGLAPFTSAQIELLKTFAGQAVIAVENTRLFTELPVLRANA